MTQLRLTFLANGDNFNIETCVHQLGYEKFILDNEYSNSIAFTHKNEFCQYYDEQYELDFYELIVNNIDILKENNADDFCLFIEVYVKPYEQCNFEILNQGFIKLLGAHNFRMPISFYNVDE